MSTPTFEQMWNDWCWAAFGAVACTRPKGHKGSHQFNAERFDSYMAARRVAAEDRAATVHLYGEERVAELEEEANRD